MGLSNYDNEVYNAEGVLRAKGYFKATPDRNYDIDTAIAVKKFQIDCGLDATGVIDKKTRVCLNNSLITLRNQNDMQYTKAVESLNIFKRP